MKLLAWRSLLGISATLDQVMVGDGPIRFPYFLETALFKMCEICLDIEIKDKLTNNKGKILYMIFVQF